MRPLELRFYLDPRTREPHIYEHGVSEDEVEEALRNVAEKRRGDRDSLLVIGSTDAGRVLRVIYVPDEDSASVFVITAYDLTGKALKAHRRRQRRKK